MRALFRLLQVVFLAALSALMLCQCGVKEKEKDLDACLIALDSLLYINPDFVLDSLNHIPAVYSEGQRAYFSLIKAIALNRTGFKFKTDTLIEYPYRFYKNTYQKQGLKAAGTTFNYARACLYAAIIKYGIKSKDMQVYPLLKDAQQLFEDMGENTYCLALTYASLGNLNNDYRENKMSDYYYNLALDQFYTIHDSISATRLKIDIAASNILTRKYDVVYSMIQSIKLTDLVTDDIKYAYYNLCATYYAVKRDYNKAIAFAKLKSTLVSPQDKGLAKINYLVSRYYSFLKEKDSALIYAEKAIRSAINSDVTSEKIHFYFRNLGDIYHKAGDYRLASVAYRKAFVHSLSSTSLFHKNRIAEIERNYNRSLQISDLKRHKAEFNAIVISFIAIMLISLLVIGQLLYKNRINREVKKNMELHQAVLESDLKQSKAMIDVVSVSLGVLPNFIDKVNDLSAKTFSSDPVLYDTFQREIGFAKAGIRKRLLDLVNNKSLVSACPLLKNLDILSNQEKMITLLLEQQYRTKYIAGVLNITQSSVRASKVKIRNKVIALDIPQDEKEKILALL